MESMDALSTPAKAHAGYEPPPGGNDDGDDENNHKKPAVRKRTKTGCMSECSRPLQFASLGPSRATNTLSIACRKRRIKCDEGRPRCGNCTKSKRDCEGYNQRVIFKETMGLHGGPYGVMGGYPVEPSHGYANHMASSHGQPSSHNSHPLLAPKPPSFDLHGPFYPHAPPPHAMELPQQVPETFNFNDPYHAQAMPPPPVSSKPGPQPLDVSSVAGSSWAGYSDRAGEAPPSASQCRINPAPSGLRSRETQIAAVYDPDIDVDYASGDGMASGSDGEGDADAMDQGQELQRTRRLNFLIDGRAIAHHEVDETRMRTFSAYAEGHTLTSYIPTPSLSGLSDPQTLSVFRHFIYVTGPSMSLYERHPFDHSKVSPDVPIPQSGQNIWTCE